MVRGSKESRDGGEKLESTRLAYPTIGLFNLLAVYFLEISFCSFPTILSIAENEAGNAIKAPRGSTVFSTRGLLRLLSLVPVR